MTPDHHENATFFVAAKVSDKERKPDGKPANPGWPNYVKGVLTPEEKGAFVGRMGSFTRTFSSQNDCRLDKANAHCLSTCFLLLNYCAWMYVPPAISQTVKYVNIHLNL